MSSRRLHNRAVVRRAAPGSLCPFVVESFRDVVEHVQGGPRVLSSRMSYTVHHVGRYWSAASALAACIRAARRYGGLAFGADGCPLRAGPFPRPRGRK